MSVVPAIAPVNAADMAVVVLSGVPVEIAIVWLGVTCQARPAPETMVVPGAMPHAGVDGGHAMTCPTARAPLVTVPTVSEVPLIPPVKVASEYDTAKVGATVSIFIVLLLPSEFASATAGKYAFAPKLGGVGGGMLLRS